MIYEITVYYRGFGVNNAEIDMYKYVEETGEKEDALDFIDNIKKNGIIIVEDFTGSGGTAIARFIPPHRIEEIQLI